MDFLVEHSCLIKIHELKSCHGFKTLSRIYLIKEQTTGKAVSVCGSKIGVSGYSHMGWAVNNVAGGGRPRMPDAAEQGNRVGGVSTSVYSRNQKTRENPTRPGEQQFIREACT